ncbi:hypothetical protein FA09DRAFT_331812 [Tilletiopsis washingtonensis]|uniref:Uncharacterized protein n=1 Tax=Tilletiopsis washingtonensis TaxID=58919 RepID=A0A316Z252_9BASI|nr:hypothetical protein FA09DRAFT_331812 [Tilletiopsis washingtonensis]PWN95867.1 hypothetical protein FA09DRAFT_331812 [Tilletiopsis washingtonensis]
MTHADEQRRQALPRQRLPPRRSSRRAQCATRGEQVPVRSKESREEEVGAEDEEEKRDHGCRALGEVKERRGSKRRRGQEGRAPACDALGRAGAGAECVRASEGQELAEKSGSEAE